MLRSGVMQNASQKAVTGSFYTYNEKRDLLFERIRLTKNVSLYELQRADTYPTRQAATHGLCVTASKIDRQNNANGLLAHLCGDNKDICPIKSIQGSFKFKKLEYPKEIEVSPTDSLGKQDSIAKLNDRNMTRFIEQEEAITLFKHMMVYGFLSEPEAITVLAGFPSIDNISSQKLFQRVIDLQQSTIDSRPRVLLKSPNFKRENFY